MLIFQGVIFRGVQHVHLEILLRSRLGVRGVRSENSPSRWDRGGKADARAHDTGLLKKLIGNVNTVDGSEIPNNHLGWL